MIYPYFPANINVPSYWDLGELRKQVGDFPACEIWASQVASGEAFKVNGRDVVRFTPQSNRCINME